MKGTCINQIVKEKRERTLLFSPLLQQFKKTCRLFAMETKKRPNSTNLSIKHWRHHICRFKCAFMQNTACQMWFSSRHRWACLPKQQTSFTIYHLPTKKNKLPFFLSVCSKQKEVCCLHFFVCSKRTKVAVCKYIYRKYLHKMELYLYT